MASLSPDSSQKSLVDSGLDQDAAGLIVSNTLTSDEAAGLKDPGTM